MLGSRSASPEPRPRRTVKWGCYRIPEDYASGHFLFLGATGSGKTVLIKMLMKSVFQPEGGKDTSRSVVYNAKGDSYSLLCSLGVKDRVLNLHPFDARGVAWDLAADADSPVLARQIASILIPQPATGSGAEKFFTDTVRDLATATMTALHELCGVRWSFRDLLLLLLEPDELTKFLKRSERPSVKRAAKVYLETSDPRTRGNIMATASAALSIYEPIAAAWEKRKQNGKISIREWVSTDRILLLGNDETARESLDAVNRAIFQRIVDEVLNLPEKGKGMPTYFLLDEVREAGRLDGLRRLLNKGRSKGARVVLGCQDIEGLQAVYGDHEGREILAQCSNVVVLNLVSPETAKWAAGLFGEEFQDIRGRSESRRANDYLHDQERSEVRPVVTTEEILNMRRIHPSTGISGFYRSQALQESAKLREHPPRERICPWKEDPENTDYAWAEAVEVFLPRGSEEEDFRPGEPDDQILKPWDARERIPLFGLPGSIQNRAAEPAAPPPQRDGASGRGLNRIKDM